MDLIAHRGIWQDIKDSNKYESLKLALESNDYIGIETDVRVSKDQKYILYHNALYQGNLVKNTLFKKMTNVTLLSDLLKINTDKIIILELKDFNMDIDKFLDYLKNFNRNIYLMSFNLKILDNIKAKTSKYPVGVLNYIINTNEDYNLDFICILNDVLSDYIIQEFYKKKIKVIGYGVRKNAKLNYNIPYIIDSKYKK